MTGLLTPPAEVLRRAFHKHLGISPAAYRERFRLAA
jgi:transcriptional regulator GlxA family with amidase domain